MAKGDPPFAYKYLNIGVWSEGEPLFEKKVIIEHDGITHEGMTDVYGNAEIQVPGNVRACNIIINEPGFQLLEEYHENLPNVLYHGIEVQLIKDVIVPPIDPPIPPVEPPSTPDGILWLNGSVLQDNNGWRFHIGTSFFAALWAYKYDNERLRTNLKWLADKKIFSYIRVLGCVGPYGWSDRTVDPAWENYYADVSGLTDLVSSYGMRTQWTVIGDEHLVDNEQKRLDLINGFGNVLTNQREQLELLEVINEYYIKGLSKNEIRTLGKILKNHLNVPTALSAYDIQINDDLYTNSSADILTIHLDRNTSGTGGTWRPVRQPWEVQFIEHKPRAWFSNEPCGPQSSIYSETDPLRIAMSAAVVQLCGGAAYTLHTGAGIRFGGKEDLAVGRAANFWEVPNIDAICNALRNVLELMPSDIANWSRHNSNGNYPDYPFDTNALQPYLLREDFLRAFCAIRGDEFVFLPIRVQRDVPFTARKKMFLEVFEVLGKSKISEHTLDAGRTFTILNTHEAYVVRGKLL